MQTDHTVTVEEAVQVLAMVGDLSMGQPTDHSIRSAVLAERLALADGAPPGAAPSASARRSASMAARVDWSVGWPMLRSPTMARTCTASSTVTVWSVCIAEL